MDEHEIDGYWLRMGHLAVDTLNEGGYRDGVLSPEKISAAAEWFAFLLNQAHDMGMRLGESKGRYVMRIRASSHPGERLER